MVVHCLLLENREEKPQRQAEYDRSCHNYVQCAIKKILECLSNNFRNVIKIKFTCWYLHVHKKFKRNDFSTPYISEQVTEHVHLNNFWVANNVRSFILC